MGWAFTVINSTDNLQSLWGFDFTGLLGFVTASHSGRMARKTPMVLRQANHRGKRGRPQLAAPNGGGETVFSASTSVLEQHQCGLIFNNYTQ